MTSKMGVIDKELSNTFPPIINTNPREKIDFEKISIKSINVAVKEKLYSNTECVYQSPQNPIQAIPLYQLSITWSPNNLCFEILEREVITELWLWNNCSCTVYIHCCGLWDTDDKARLGAGWICRPRTRLRMAPGLMSKLFIRAKPRQHSPVPSASAGLQLAAAHIRDHVTGYFVVPIHVKFLNYLPPSLAECE